MLSFHSFGFDSPDKRTIQGSRAGGEKHGRNGESRAVTHGFESTVDTCPVDFDGCGSLEIVILEKHLNAARQKEGNEAGEEEAAFHGSFKLSGG